MTRPVRWLAVVGLTAALLAACGTPSAPAPGASGDAPPGAPEERGEATRSGDELSGTLTVLAAASLTETFTELGERFEQLHPSLTVRLSFGGSSTLAQQVLAGAPADVLVTASRSTMEPVTDAGAHAAAPSLLASNVLQIAVPPDNPANVSTLADLARPDVTLAVCAVEVPCGAASRKLMDTAGLVTRPATFERDVRAVLTKVRLGEVDAGLVYRTDVAAAGDDVLGIPLVEANDPAVVNDYLVAPLAEAPNPSAADAFVAFVLAEDGREVLDDAGFLLP